MKRKLFPFLLLLAVAIPSLAACGNGGESTQSVEPGPTSSIQPGPTSETSTQPTTSITSETSDTSSTSEEEPHLIVPDVLTIHYHMDTPSYDSKRFYVWITGKNGVEMPKPPTDDFGMYLTVNPSDTEVWKKHSVFFFIVKNQGTWAGQSTDTEISYEKFVAKEDPTDHKYKLDVWCIDGEAGAVEVYATREETEGDKLTYAKFKNWNTIHITGDGEKADTRADKGKVSHYDLYALTKDYYLTDPDLQYQSLPLYLIKSADPMSKDFDIDLGANIEPNKTYMIKCRFVNYPDKIKSKNVSFEKLYSTTEFKNNYTYNGNDLGVTYSKERSTFKLWAPTSARVQLKVYFQGTPSSLDPEGTMDMDWFIGYEMEYGPYGVYSVTVDGDLNTYYYNYSVTNSEGTSEVVDPYARAAGINGARGEIIDLDETDPEGWSEVFGTPWDGRQGYDISSPNEISVYETHVRDVTMHETWTTGDEERDSELRGTYLGMIEKGTTYSEVEAGTQNVREVKTGFDHIEEMGMTAVELLPVFDHDNDERDPDFNWGYNPLNYNVPEGSYSSNAYDGATAVKELKQLILAYAKNANHTRIIMDVVFNHVSSVSSNNLNRIVPKYFFRLTEDGYYADGSGCGNEVNSEAPMMRKFIVDSIKYWATEYGIKAFRFDLMKLIDRDTMRLVKDAVYAIDHDAFVFGEGWSLGYSGTTPGTDSSVIYSQLYPTQSSPGWIGGFNDAGRDAVRGSNDGGWGSYKPYPSWGFMSQGSSDVGDKSVRVADMLRGKNSNCDGGNPNQTVNYVSCHDNYTVFDQLNFCLGPGVENPAASTEPNPADVCKASLGAHASVFVSQGISFMQGGEEVFRSKVQDLNQEDYDVFPYPDYITEGEIYDNTINHQDTPHGKKDTLLGKQPCTDDVRMYGKVISHNSYRSNDNVNAYDYSRMINISRQGVKVSVYTYSRQFIELTKLKNKVGHYSYPDNFTDTKVWAGNTGDMSTLVAGAVRGNKTGHNDIVYFMSGRNTTNQIDNGDAKSGTLLWNSFGPNDHSYSWSGSCTLKLAQYQFLIFKI